MTVFARTWDAAYEDQPPEAQSVSQGNERMQEIKIDVRERLEVDHSWLGDVDDGAHKKVTLIEQASDPASAAERGLLYVKDDSGDTELYYRDAGGNIVQMTQDGTIRLLQLQNSWIKSQITPEVNVTFATPLIIDAALSNAFRCTLTGNFTLDEPINGVSGQVITIRFIQDGTGDRIITYDSALRGNPGDDLVLSTAAAAQDFMVMYRATTNWRVLNLKKAFGQSPL